MADPKLTAKVWLCFVNLDLETLVWTQDVSSNAAENLRTMPEYIDGGERALYQKVWEEIELMIDRQEDAHRKVEADLRVAIGRRILWWVLWHGDEHSILNGKGTLMPAFSGRVSEDQAQALVGYVRAFGPKSARADEAPASDFEKRFREMEAEWDELQRQRRELQKPAKP